MGCENCEKEDGSQIAYYRWGRANIGMIGCKEHLREIFDVLSKHQKEMCDDPTKR